MCDSLKILSTVKSGELSFCENCKIYHLEFNNLYFVFNDKEFDYFKDYISDLDCQYWECKYAKTAFKKKIPVPSMQENLVLMFSRQEVEELRFLANCKRKSNFIKVDDIDYKFVLN